MRNISTYAMVVLIWCILLFGNLNDANSQPTPVDPQTAALLQAKLDDLIITYNLKGLSASVIIPGKGTWIGASGISHANVPIDTAMVFAYGSITKNFTAAAILLLQEDGLLNLSDSLHKFLPTFVNINPNITIKQLLQHTSGVYNYSDNPAWNNMISNNPSQAMTPQYLLNNYVNAPYFAPGTSIYYSNTNYTLLGLIIEQVTGQSYASFVRQRLLNPLQLTSVYTRDHEPATGLMPHNWDAASISDPGTDVSSFPLTAVFGTSAAEAALFGNAYDVAHWGQFLFTGQVLQNTSLQLMKQFMSVNGSLVTGYGLGLMRFSTGNTEAWGHSGSVLGFGSGLMFSQADSVVVSILSNKSVNGGLLAWELLQFVRQQLLTSTPSFLSDLQYELICYPNPVIGSGNIRYTLQQAQDVEITLYNSLGQTVQTLLNQHQLAGEHSLIVDTSKLPAGIYFCNMQTSDSKLVHRWVVTK